MGERHDTTRPDVRQRWIGGAARVVSAEGRWRDKLASPSRVGRLFLSLNKRKGRAMKAKKKGGSKKRC